MRESTAARTFQKGRLRTTVRPSITGIQRTSTLVQERRITQVQTDDFLTARYHRPAAPRPVAFPYVVAVLAYALLFGVWQVEPVPLRVHLAAVFVAAIGFIPLVRWYAQESRGIPVFELICLSYVVQFSTPVYLQPNRVQVLERWVQLSWDGVFEALLLTALGMGTMIAGYYLVKNGPFASGIPRLDLPLDSAMRANYITFSIVIGAAFRLAQMMGLSLFRINQFQAILYVLTGQINLAIVLLAYQVYSKDKTAASTTALWICVALVTILGLATGMLEETLVPLALVFAVRWHATRKLPTQWLVLGIVFFALFNTVKIEVRQQVWYSKTRYSILESVELWIDKSFQLAEDIIRGDTRRQGQTIIQTTSFRLDLLHKFVWVRQMTPDVVPYYNGDSYTYFLYGWIPRLVWPDKPSPNINHRIDVDYQFLYDWQGAVVAIGQLPEAYINFGIGGIVVVMLIQGLVFGGLETWLNGPHSEGGRAIYVALMVFFLNGIGSSASMWFGALFQHILARALIMRPFTTGWSAHQDADKAPFSTNVNLLHASTPNPAPLGSGQRGLVRRRKPPHSALYQTSSTRESELAQ